MTIEMDKLLKIIDEEISKLNDQDVEGRIWWNKFRELVLLHTNYNTMTILTIKTATDTVTIPVPSFWKNKNFNEWTAILDEKTMINICQSDDFAIIKNGGQEIMQGDIVFASQNFATCTEHEFMEAYVKVLKSLSLQPELI